LSRVWEEDERIPSIRDIASSLEVNPNTVMRSYAILQEKGIIYTKRGVGYFLSENAIDTTICIKREEFIHKILPEIFSSIDTLDIPIEKIVEYYRKHKK
jgi:DNA-binding transcriptional regulator YhcF (GntR family)